MAIKPGDEDHGPAMKALLKFIYEQRDSSGFAANCTKKDSADYTERVAEKTASDDTALQKIVEDHIAKRIASGKPPVTRLPPATKHSVSDRDWDEIVTGQTSLRARMAKKAEARADTLVRVEPRNVTKSNRYFARRLPKKV